MYCSYRSELKVKKELDRLHVPYYLPMEYQLVEHDGERRRELVPAIHNLIFVHSSQREITKLKMYNKKCTTLQYMVSNSADDEKSEIIVVPSRAMENFIRVSSSHDDHVRHLTYSDYLDKQGKRVRIIDGNFAGVEGVIKRIKRDRIVVVLLKGIAAVAITQLPPSFIELIDDKEGRGNPLELRSLATEGTQE